MSKEESTPGQAKGVDPLEAVFLTFAHKLLTQLEEWTKVEPVPEYQTHGVQFTDEGWTTTIESQPAYWVVVKKHYPQPWKWPESRTCVRRHLEAGVLKPGRMSDAAGKPIIAPTFDEVAPFLAVKLAKPVVDVVTAHDNAAVSDDQLVRRYREYRRRWELNEYRYEVFAPLVNFRSEVDNLKAGEHVQITRMTPSLKTRIADPESFFGPPHSQIAMVSSCVRAEYVLPREESGGIPQEIREEVNLFLTTLRLLKPGAVGYGAVYSFCVDDPGSGMGSSGDRWSIPGPTYELKDDDAPAVLTVFDKLREGAENGWLRQLEVALDRFADSYERRQREDKLIDLTIALESLLLSGVKEELRYRLSLRGAALLRGRFEPGWTQAVLQAMYDARSGIVHGGKKLNELKLRIQVPDSPESVAVNQLPKLCENVTRAILLEYVNLLQDGRSIEKANSDLDSQIITGLGKGRNDAH